MSGQVYEIVLSSSRRNHVPPGQFDRSQSQSQMLTNPQKVVKKSIFRKAIPARLVLRQIVQDAWCPNLHICPHNPKCRKECIPPSLKIDQILVYVVIGVHSENLDFLVNGGIIQPVVTRVAPSSSGQDGGFSALKPGFDSPWRYHLLLLHIPSIEPNLGLPSFWFYLSGRLARNYPQQCCINW